MALYDRVDISSGSAKAILTVQDLYPGGILLEQFGTDSGVVSDQYDISETRMGVDGKIVGGTVYNERVVNITLEASSPAYNALVNVAVASDQNGRVYVCDLVWRVPSRKMTFVWSTGILQNGTIVPAQNTVLGPTTWTINFERLTVAPF